ncbi:MAG: polysaccharide deacetylase family protein [Actinomycetota bacterium]|nr:polysaccharide deacetylase family protein [Actinomycetota bacterium]
MDRRQFLTHSGVGVAALAIGGAAGAAEEGLRERHQERDRRESQDSATDGHGVQRVWWSLETEQRVASLTFDDGPHHELTPRVLAMLGAHEVRGTFFMIGQNAAAHPKLVADVVAGGHEVANHTWSHGRVVEQDPATVHEEILRGARALRSITGRHTRWFRPPRGMVSGDVLSGASAAHNELVLWSMTRGGPSVKGSEAILSHMTTHLHPGAIVDLHDGTGVHPDDANLLQRRHEELAVLPRFLAQSIAAGYRFVTVAELLQQVAPVGPSTPAHADTRVVRSGSGPGG